MPLLDSLWQIEFARQQKAPIGMGFEKGLDNETHVKVKDEAAFIKMA